MSAKDVTVSETPFFVTDPPNRNRCGGVGVQVILSPGWTVRSAGLRLCGAAAGAPFAGLAAATAGAVAACAESGLAWALSLPVELHPISMIASPRIRGR